MSLGLDIPIEVLQSMLDDAWDLSQGTNSPGGLRDSLRSFEKQVSPLYRSGSLSSVSKNSTSQSYAAGANALTTLQLQRAWRMLINLFDYCSQEITLELGPPQDIQYPTGGVNDTNIYARMKLMLGVPVSEYSSDLTLLLLPPTIAPPVPMTQ